MKTGMIVGAAVLAMGLAGCVEDTGSGSSTGYNRNVVIANQTGRTIWTFQGSNSGSNYWGPDLLGPNVINSGSSMLIDFNDGSGQCNFDFRIVFVGGAVLEDFRVNVCQIGVYNVR